MSSDQIAIRVSEVGKCFSIYDRPIDRLKQFVLPKIAKIFGLSAAVYAKQFWAVKDVSFEIRRGQSLGVIGRNGSGKSTLLQLICGTLTPNYGSIEVAGRVAALLELGSGFNPEFTGRENIYLNASVLGLSKLETDSRYNKIVQFADIGDFIDQPVKTYSSGMMVRLAFAVIAHVDADVLIIDEALAVGDMVFTQKCMRFINEFKKNKTLLFVSHDLNAVSSVSDKCLWLKDGVNMAFGDTLAVIDMYSQDALGQELLENSIESVVIKGREMLEANNAESTSEILSCNQINKETSAVGEGRAEILSAFFSINSKATKSFKGGEVVGLTYLCRFNDELKGLLLGFTIKDKTGQKIIEENNLNFLSDNKLHAFKGSYALSSFYFTMPHLKGGEYSVDLAIAEGSKESYIHQNWYFDAIQILVIPVEDSSGVFRMKIDSFETKLLKHTYID